MAKKPDVTKMPAKGVLTTLINKDKELNADIAEIKGDLGERIAKAVKDHNLHAGAFKLAKKLHKMDAVKLLAFLTHFDDYRQKLELDVLAGESLDLDSDDDHDEEGEHQPETIAEAAAASDAAVQEAIKTVN